MDIEPYYTERAADYSLFFTNFTSMLVKCILLVLFFAVMIGVGIYCRRTASDVQGFVLGGRNVGSWLTAFAFGTSYFSAVIFVGYAGQFGGSMDLPRPGSESATP